MTEPLRRLLLSCLRLRLRFRFRFRFRLRFRRRRSQSPGHQAALAGMEQHGAARRQAHEEVSVQLLVTTTLSRSTTK